MTCNCECHETKYPCNNNCLPCDRFLVINKEESKELLEYFMTDAGWISFEKFEKVHEFIKRLQDFIDEK